VSHRFLTTIFAQWTAKGSLTAMRTLLFSAVCLTLLACRAVDAQTGDITPNTLLSLPPEYLLSLYQHGAASPVPPGPIRGIVLSQTGTPLAGAMSLGGRAVWQGKIFQCNGMAVNRFFGVRSVPGLVSFGPSWYDGAASLILDYEHTSKVYRKYRDEIRQVAPGLYLGLMYDRTTCPPRLVRFFALERCP
jgi:hypothetical protein